MLFVLLAAAGCATACPEVPQSPAEHGVPAATPPRGMVVDDLFRLSELEDVAVAPDGKWLVATITRPGVANPCPTCNYKATGDVWLLDMQSGAWRNVTNGDADGSSSWSPVWSPDGRRIAFVSTRGDDPAQRARDIRLHVYDVVSGAITRVAERGVFLQADMRAEVPGLTQPFLWLDDSSLLTALLPEGTNAVEQILYWQRGVAESTRAWEKWSRGEVTASVLDSAAPAPLPTVDLQRVDVAGGAPRELAKLPRWDLWDLRLRLQIDVTPDRRRAAFVAVTGTMPLDPKVAITDAIRTFGAGWFPLDAGMPATWAELDKASEHVAGELLGWSPDGGAFVVREATEPGTQSRRTRLLRVLASGAVRPIEMPQAKVDRVVWTPGSQLVVRASPEQSATGPARADWWRVDGDAAPCNLTALLPRSPGALVTARGIDRLFAAVEGAMWSIDPADSSVRSLCKLEGHSVSPLPAGRTPQQTTLLVSAYSVAGRPSVEWLTMSAAADAAEAVRIVFPTATSTMIPGDPRCGALAFRDDTAAGTAIWTTDGTGQHAVKRRELNAHVAEIAEGERSLVAYRSTDGAELQAAVILPPGHVAGTRHPVVAWVYGGMIVRDKNLAIASKSSTRPLNLELLAGHGYAVVVPSVPLPAAGANGDPMTAICKSVLPCIDRIVEIGIGDPQRLAVMGHSTGGYTTYAVVTQTDRFRAAIALSGHPDLVSLHTQLFPAERTNGRAHEGLATAMFTEDEPLFLGGPPWADMARYVRNSPLTYLDRVTTPLLIVHGDMDGAPIQQGEQAFVGLYRLGKRARFVRYWGEGHVIGSAANVRHLWAQIFEWLDTNLAVPPLQQPR